MRFARTRNKWAIIVAFVLIAALIGAVIVLAVNLNKQITTKTVGASAFTQGSLDENGKVVKSDENIYSKDYIKVDGLKVVVKEKADIEYKLYFYGEDKAFISASADWLTADLDSSTIPEGACFVRVVINPVEDNDINLFEIAKYASQLTITYNK